MLQNKICNNLLEENRNDILIKNLSLDIKRKQNEVLKIKKEIKIIIPEDWINFPLLDLQMTLFKLVKKFVTRINNHLNGLKRLCIIGGRRSIKSVNFIRDKMEYVVTLGGSFWIYSYLN